MDCNKPLDGEITFSQLAMLLEQHLSATPRHSKDEKLINVKRCPICRKVIKKEKRDLDVVTHIALCAYSEPGNGGHVGRGVEGFLLGGFLTEAYAQRKWYSKVLSYVGYGGYNLGKNNANILVQDRATGQLVEEKMPSYIRLGIRLLYQSAGSRTAVESKMIKNLLKNLSVKQGRKFDDPYSAKAIPHFIKFHKLDVDEILEPLESYENFNEFFYRKLKPTARTLVSPDPKVAVSPADCRMSCFKTIDSAKSLWIKGQNFTVSKLLGNDDLAKYYEGGALGIFRLAPQDYHRFHMPVDGVVGPTTFIHGTYYTVNPMAIRTPVDVYTENIRAVTTIDSPIFGKVAYVAIGAMMVGSIILTSKEGQEVKRLDEHGYFAFGGS